ncbi:DUF4442 domain-containing protein [Bordetella genomosp. 12]|uniref:DUF4442 domain-containing protein n=1 Tax=Bordetella genomosp. 12 TaxID=463035 RepID=A0A261VAR7_9BORD|nr:DUF4442 domain-containing protein [Bordetella genomosp. 12]OZI71254.1 DUF4442 domain-containing protein [Bordetella genomosp. 12]
MQLDWLRYVPPAWRAAVLRLGFNLHPAFRATGGRVTHVARDYRSLRVRLPLNRRTRNLVGSIYGGALFAVTDGAHPTLLMLALGRDVIVWDKAASIRFRRPAYETLYAEFHLPRGEIAQIRTLLDSQHETTRLYTVELKDAAGEVYAVVERSVYLADKDFYRQKTSGAVPWSTPTDSPACASSSREESAP